MLSVLLSRMRKDWTSIIKWGVSVDYTSNWMIGIYVVCIPHCWTYYSAVAASYTVDVSFSVFVYGRREVAFVRKRHYLYYFLRLEYAQGRVPLFSPPNYGVLSAIWLMLFDLANSLSLLFLHFSYHCVCTPQAYYVMFPVWSTETHKPIELKFQTIFDAPEPCCFGVRGQIK